MPDLFNVSIMLGQIPKILVYLPVTIEIAIISLFFGLLIGLGLALLQIKKVPVLNRLAGWYITVIRGTPILVQLYVTYFGIPIILRYINYYRGTEFNINSIPKIIFAIVALALNNAAYNAVTIRASIESVDPGQIEAASSLGMSYGQTLRRIIIPEAIEVAVPSIGNSAINLMKSTSLAFSCAVIEITAQAKIIAGRDFRYLEAYVALAIIYLVMTILLEHLVKLIAGSVKVPDVVPNRRYIESK